MRARWLACLLPLGLAVVFWWFPPRGDDAYYHSVGAVEQVRAWEEGAVFPRYHRGWNGGTGSFAPTVYAPIPMAIQGGLARLVGDGQRAVGLSLGLAVLAAAVFLTLATGRPEAMLLAAAPYFLAVAVTRATTTEAWALAGAAVVLALGMPGPAVTVRRGLGLAAGVVLVAGSQVGMLLQLGCLLTVAWVTWIVVSRADQAESHPAFTGDGLRASAWASAGLMVGAVFWMPLVTDGRNLALGELVEGALDWRRNFLPGNSELSVFLSVIAVCLGLCISLVFVRGKGGWRLPAATAAAAALFFTVGLSTPVWLLPGMNGLQFPWRFLGPATILVVVAVGSLRGRWRWVAIALVLLPGAGAPLRLDTAGSRVPVGATPAELARITQENWGLAPLLPSARGLYAPGFDRVASLQELGVQQAVIVAEERNVTGGSWHVTTAAAKQVVLPIQWWPEWSISVDDRDMHFTNHKGLVAVEAPGGTSTVRAVLLPSRSRAFGGAVSLVGMILIVGLAWFEGWRTQMAFAERGSG